MIRAYSPAKINLTFEIIGRRDDGYHFVNTVMQAVTLYETVDVCKNGLDKIELTVSGNDIDPNECTTVYRSADLFFKKTGTEQFGVSINLKKSVPVGAGLAGGSADAAAVLAALNEISGARLSVAELCRIGAHIGADVPFCILGGTAFGTGTGTKLSPLPKLPDCAIVIAKPDESISTAHAYRLIDEQGGKPKSISTKMLDAINNADILAVASLLHNDFDYVTNLPKVDTIKQTMIKHGTLGCQMTGSGSAVFGIFINDDDAKRCYDALKTMHDDVFLCRPESKGVRTIKIK